jgi:hypothetical protein
MTRHFRQSQSTDHDLVPYTNYTPKADLPAEYDALRAVPLFKPIELDPIINSGPNLPTELDLNDPVAFFRLFFNDNLIQYLVNCTNH